MKGLNGYLYEQYEGRRGELESAGGTIPGLSEAHDRISRAMGQKRYMEAMEAIGAREDNRAFEAYVLGYKDGMRFLMGMMAG